MVKEGGMGWVREETMGRRGKGKVKRWQSFKCH